MARYRQEVSEVSEGMPLPVEQKAKSMAWDVGCNKIFLGGKGFAMISTRKNLLPLTTFYLGTFTSVLLLTS